MACKIRPLHELVIVRKLDNEKKTAAGIVIPDSASDDKPFQGEVLAVGPGRVLPDGTTRPLEVKVGDRVLFERFSGMKIKYEDDEMIFLREDEVLAILNV